MLDRPISEFDGPVDSVRVPVVPPNGECKPFQEVLIELASRLKFPAFTTRRTARASSSDYPDFVVNFQPQPGHRLPDGLARQGRRRSTCAASRIRSSGRCTRRTTACSSTTCPRRCTSCATGTASTSTSRRTKGWRQKNDPVAARALLRHAAELPARRAGQDEGPPAARRAARAHRDLLRSAAVLVRAARGRSDRPRRAIRSTRSRSGRWRCTTRGIRRTRGCARSTATTTCRSIR